MVPRKRAFEVTAGSLIQWYFVQGKISRYNVTKMGCRHDSRRVS